MNASVCIKYNGWILLTATLQPLNVSSTTDSIIILWTAPEFLPTAYVVTTVCALLCSISLPYLPNITMTTSSSTSVTLVSLLPGSECNSNLTVQYGSAKSYMLIVTARTMSEGEESIGVYAYLCVLLLWTVCIHDSNSNQHSSLICTHELSCLDSWDHKSDTCLEWASMPISEWAYLWLCHWVHSRWWNTFNHFIDRKQSTHWTDCLY